MIENRANDASLLKNRNVEYRLTRELNPYSRNARTHSDKQIHQIARSIETFGFVNPILIDGESGIIAGHGRLEAAKLLEMKEVPTILINHLTDKEKRAYILADNRLAELAGWDEEILAIEFKDLLSIETDFDITITGFEMAEIDLTMLGTDPEPDPADEIPDHVPEGPAISRPHDLWLLGNHVIFCGNALQTESYAKLMGDGRARMVITDPPYNVPVTGHICGSGSVHHKEFAMASGEMSEEEFTRFLSTTFSHCTSFSHEGSLHYICMDWRHMGELMAAGRAIYSEMKNLCIWNKNNGGMGSLYRSKHELVFVYKHGQTPHVNNVQLGGHGRYRTNVWNYPGISGFHQGRMDALQMHPTVKPVALIADAILDASNRADIVLDPFGGSGTTVIASERTGRKARVLEIDPQYVDVTIHRWQKITGKSAMHAETNLSFEQISERRTYDSEGVDSVTYIEE